MESVGEPMNHVSIVVTEEQLLFYLVDLDQSLVVITIGV